MVRRAPGVSEAKVYDVSTRTSVPLLHSNLSIGQKSETALKRARRKLEITNTDTNLIQDFEFPTLCNRVKLTNDGNHIFACGTYPPQLHVYDTEQLSLKFKRHVDCEIIDFQILADDWRKFVLLTEDRYLDFHSPFGSHHRVRIPKHGRDLCVNKGSCDVFVCGQGKEIWRFNAEQGRFLNPLSSRCGVDSGVNVCGVNPVNGLLVFGGDTGIIDIYDPRIIGNNQLPVGSLNVSHYVNNEDTSVSSVRFDGNDGISLGVGTNNGFNLIYDLRRNEPLLVKDQGNGLPINSLRFHNDRLHCISADTKSIKIWNRENETKNMAVIECDKNINHLCVFGHSGVMCVGVEARKVKSFYIPSLGNAPKWCSFLDTFTEELENGRGNNNFNNENEHGEGEELVYENYKFVTEDDLKVLGMTNLIGTNVLKGYMHGYFVHQKLHQRAMEVIQPFAYEKYKKEKAKERIENKTKSRITKVHKQKHTSKVMVNQNVVDSLQAKEESRKNKQKHSNGMSVLEDDRFTKMFENKDFKVDEDSERFQFLNPGVSQSRHHRGNKFGRKEEEEESDEEYLERFELVDDANDNTDGQGNKKLWSDDEDEGENDNENESNDESEGESEGEKVKSKAKGRVPKMYEIEKESDGRSAVISNDYYEGVATKNVKKKVSLGERITGSKTSKKAKQKRI